MRRVFEVLRILWNLFIGVRPVSVPLLFVLVLVLTLAILVRTYHVQSGFTGKTIWDWMEVFGVPVVVVVIAGGFAIWGQRASQRAEQDRERDTERAREATLRGYLDRMSDLILNYALQESAEDSPTRAVAHARTLGALRSLNGPRKGILVRFLHESDLIKNGHRVVSLDGADLTGSDLSFANLKGSDLSGANLRDADFAKADLRDANLKSSVVDNDQLAKAKDLLGGIMPDGTKMTADWWGKFKVP